MPASQKLKELWVKRFTVAFYRMTTIHLLSDASLRQRFRPRVDEVLIIFGVAFRNRGVQAVFQQDEETRTWEVVQRGRFMGLVRQRNAACKPVQRVPQRYLTISPVWLLQDCCVSGNSEGYGVVTLVVWVSAPPIGTISTSVKKKMNHLTPVKNVSAVCQWTL